MTRQNSKYNRPAGRIRLLLFALCLLSIPLTLWIFVAPPAMEKLNHREWTNWVRKDLQSLANALRAYHADHEVWPPDLNFLAPIHPPMASVNLENVDDPAEQPKHSYIRTLPVDPYAPNFDFPNGEVYMYKLTKGENRRWLLISPGPNFRFDFDPEGFGVNVAPEIAYDPTNGLISDGDIFIMGP